MTTALGLLNIFPDRPVFLAGSHDRGGGSGPGGTQEGDGGEAGGRLARYDRDTMGSDVMGRSLGDENCFNSVVSCVSWLVLRNIKKGDIL